MPVLKYNPCMRFPIVLFAGILLLTGCSPPTDSDTPAPFSAPAVAVTPTPLASPIPTDIPPSPTPACINNLTFGADVTIPDGTAVSPGSQIDKRWKVLNSGTCNWDQGYKLVLITGAEMGSSSPQALYPALAGSEATVRIIFTAPAEPGIYRSAWQAVGPSGETFGDPIFIEIVVP